MLQEILCSSLLIRNGCCKTTIPKVFHSYISFHLCPVLLCNSMQCTVAHPLRLLAMRPHWESQMLEGWKPEGEQSWSLQKEAHKLQRVGTASIRPSDVTD